MTTLCGVLFRHDIKIVTIKQQKGVSLVEHALIKYHF